MTILCALFALLASIGNVTGIFDLGWRFGEAAFSKCKQKETTELKGMCAKLQEIVEDAFDEQGGALQNAFGNQHSMAEKITEEPPFSTMGDKMIDGIIKWMMDGKVRDYEKLKGEFIQRFFKWFAEVLKEVDRPGSGFQTMQFGEDGFDPEVLKSMPKRPTQTKPN